MTIENYVQKEKEFKMGLKLGQFLGASTALAIAIPLVTIGSMCAMKSIESSKLKQAAYDAKMVIYEPVTNGGAMREFYHGRPTSGPRAEMYDKMEEIYSAIMMER